MTDSLARMLEGPDAEIGRLSTEVLTLRSLVRKFYRARKTGRRTLVLNGAESDLLDAIIEEETT